MVVSIHTGYHNITDQMKGYFAKADTELSMPTIIVLQEIFGVNDVMRRTCDQLAGQGYHAICPDLFHPLGDNIQLSDKTNSDWEKAFGYYKSFNIDAALKDIQSTIAFARKQSNKIGCVGYCLGGTLSFLTALHTDIDASISYYGIGIVDHLGQSEKIKKPLMLHMAQQDEYVPEEQQEKVAEHFENNSLVTAHSYNAQHAFARIDGIHYDRVSSDLANNRSKTFFKKYLY